MTILGTLLFSEEYALFPDDIDNNARRSLRLNVVTLCRNILGRSLGDKFARSIEWNISASPMVGQWGELEREIDL